MNNKKALENYDNTRQAIGYVTRKEAQQSDYDRIGFKSGLEVHQQLLTKKKLFCRCPAGFFQKPDEYDAELIRHMRPTLSELGEYDGTALMEFKTKKEIIYRIANKTACTYDVDDTPPFPIDREALDISIEIALLSKLNIVGEVHITRKQYLDGSIPTGFQRTAIIGINGQITLKNNKKVNLIQLSIEEDSCREVSDIGHKRIYRTDRLGMPLIETVTAPELLNPDELKDACDTIRFLNRSTGKVRTGIGAGREDVNVSCTGGTRVEIKGVAHTKWIPELSHNEAFRQWALLHIRTLLNERCTIENWKCTSKEISITDYPQIQNAMGGNSFQNLCIYAVNLPHFKNILSHFTQPQKPFYDEFANRLKVIACIEKPNLLTSEDLEAVLDENQWERIAHSLNASADDAQLIFWGEKGDMATALETIEERAKMAFEGVPKETRKSLANGTTIFERVLPGADRMYPDTDSVPIPLTDKHIENLRNNIPEDFSDRYNQLRKMDIPEDCYPYLLTNNYYPLIKRIHSHCGVSEKFLGVFFGQKLKYLHGKYGQIPFEREKIYQLFEKTTQLQLDLAIVADLLKKMFEKPEANYEQLLQEVHFCEQNKENICKQLEIIQKECPCQSLENKKRINCLMGKMRTLALGNINLSELAEICKKNLIL
ncbi:MAG: Glu-tRNA(Gln) amidotransferase subunit GatE [Bacteroidales bacterium]|nr:Glu-tRNA(Gln) amidotransferase subunit GatE [Bacteroidales bacterium]